MHRGTGTMIQTALLLAATLAAHAQWDLEESHTTASLRGVDNTGGGAVWASGTDGTVLRSEDGGYLWQTCAIPPGAEKLDFRGIQAWDENNAIVMSSGPGDQSRLYKTTDGCQSWKLVFTNPDKEGFWDAIRFRDAKHGYLLGDPVRGRFAFFATSDGGSSWARAQNGVQADAGEGVFSASNSSMVLAADRSEGIDEILFVTGSPTRAHLFRVGISHGAGGPLCITTKISFCASWERDYIQPLAASSTSTGAFSVAFRDEAIGVAVGGDYARPDQAQGVAACTLWNGKYWSSPRTPPHGYRSAVAYDAKQRLWITVGPNGTDISTDDGKNWRPLRPSNGDPADADKNWNALSLPFVVGPHGRIGRLRDITPRR